MADCHTCESGKMVGKRQNFYTDGDTFGGCFPICIEGKLPGEDFPGVIAGWSRTQPGTGFLNDPGGYRFGKAFRNALTACLTAFTNSLWCPVVVILFSSEGLVRNPDSINTAGLAAPSSVINGAP